MSSSIQNLPRLLLILTILSIIGLIVTLYLALVAAGTDIEQGNVQRIFYIHMPSFFGSFIAFGCAVVGGIQYLRTRNRRWDSLALAGIEVGIALAVVNLVTGSIWARPIWNTWWTWDPRLTSDAIMILTYAAYLMLRASIDNPEQRYRFASVYGIFAFVTVIITLVIIRIRPDTIHPAVIGASPQNAQGTFEATSGVVTALIPSLIFWAVILAPTLIWYRYRLQHHLHQVEHAKAQLLRGN